MPGKAKAMNNRTGKVPLKNIRVEIWRDDELVRAQYMNFAKDTERQWFINLHIWAWSNGHEIRSRNTTDTPDDIRPGNATTIVGSSRDQ
jgi:hypothetical protein